MLREAGKKDRQQLLRFLDQHAAMMADACGPAMRVGTYQGRCHRRQAAGWLC
ncbi:MAG: DNA alkylation repair protein [Actinomycetota bacterium]|nr:DNA alkylation repair protein [Actinomycetota bacterium]